MHIHSIPSIAGLGHWMLWQCPTGNNWTIAVADDCSPIQKDLFEVSPKAGRSLQSLTCEETILSDRLDLSEESLPVYCRSLDNGLLKLLSGVEESIHTISMSLDSRCATESHLYCWHRLPLIDCRIRSGLIVLLSESHRVPTPFLWLSIPEGLCEVAVPSAGSRRQTRDPWSCQTS